MAGNKDLTEYKLVVVGGGVLARVPLRSSLYRLVDQSY